jgi:hypothetical protein
MREKQTYNLGKWKGGERRRREGRGGDEADEEKNELRIQ